MAGRSLWQGDTVRPPWKGVLAGQITLTLFDRTHRVRIHPGNNINIVVKGTPTQGDRAEPPAPTTPSFASHNAEGAQHRGYPWRQGPQHEVPEVRSEEGRRGRLPVPCPRRRIAHRPVPHRADGVGRVLRALRPGQEVLSVHRRLRWLPCRGDPFPSLPRQRPRRGREQGHPAGPAEDAGRFGDQEVRQVRHPARPGLRTVPGGHGLRHRVRRHARAAVQGQRGPLRPARPVGAAGGATGVGRRGRRRRRRGRRAQVEASGQEDRTVPSCVA